jgi:polar amino acid transport system substrate-binding protein
MKKLLISLISLSFISFIGCKLNASNIHAKDTLIVGLSAEYPPFEYQEQGKLMGFDIDVMNAIAKEMKVKIQIKDMAFNGLIPALQMGKIDIAISSITITPERSKNIDFSNQYYQNSLAIIYPKDKKQPSQDYSHHTIGVQLGSTMEKWTKTTTASMQGVKIITLDSNPPLIEKLKMGHLDYIVIENLQAIKYCQANPSLTFQSLGMVADGYGIAVKKGSSLTTSLNTALASLEQKGILAELKQKCFGSATLTNLINKWLYI